MAIVYDEVDRKELFPPTKIPAGARTATLTSMAGKLWANGATEEELREEVHNMNRDRCEPHLSSDTIEAIVQSITHYPREKGRTMFYVIAQSVMTFRKFIVEAKNERDAFSDEGIERWEKLGYVDYDKEVMDPEIRCYKTREEALASPIAGIEFPGQITMHGASLFAKAADVVISDTGAVIKNRHNIVLKDFAGDRNSEQDVANYISHVRSVARASGAAIIILTRLAQGEHD
jgi:Primase C terminal 1 (PriCT-1)